MVLGTVPHKGPKEKERTVSYVFGKVMENASTVLMV
jgi:hypothetical protein